MSSSTILRCIISLSILFSLYPKAGFSQYKYEKETRISSAKVPKSARQYIRTYFQKNHEKVRWYQEKRLNGYSFEAKFTSNGKKLSIEFDSLGVLEDIEQNIFLSEIPCAALENVQHSLSLFFPAFQIEKSQIQWTGIPDDIGLHISSNNSLSLEAKYELIVKGKVGSLWKYYEFLFDDKGRIMLQSEIIQKKDLEDLAKK